MRSYLRRIAVLAALLALPGLAAACGDDDNQTNADGGGGSGTTAQTPEVQAKIEAAEKEGELTLLLNPVVTQELGDQLVAGFKKYYDIDLPVKLVLGPDGQEIGGKLVQAAKAGLDAPTDVILNTPSGVQTTIREDLLKYIDWSWAPNIAGKDVTELVDKSRKAAAVRVTTSVQGFTYNTDLLSEEDAPKTLDAVLDVSDDVPITTTPYATGFGPQFTDAVWGEKRTFDWARTFAGKVDGFIECGEAERIASGEFALQVYDCGINETISLKEEGAPLDFVIPSDVPYLSYFYLQVPPNATHPAAAELFINWWLSPEAQRIMWDVMNWDLHTLEGSQSAEVVEEALGGGDPLVVDLDFVQRNFETLEKAEEIENIFTSTVGG